jgi:uncharacterized membrane protein YvbJ
MFCRNCGIQNADGAPTCISCGTPLDRVTNPYQATVTGPPATGPPATGEKPKNYLVESILVTLCCCIPLGIVGIVYAAQVDTKWNAGDHQGAIISADNAKKWTLIGFVVGFVLIGIQILAVIAGAADAGGGGF